MDNIEHYEMSKREMLESVLRQIDGHKSRNWGIGEYNLVANQALEFVNVVFNDMLGDKLAKSLPADTQSIYSNGDHARSTGIGKIRGFLLGLINRLDSQDEGGQQVLISTVQIRQPTSHSNLVFLVHGHDAESKETVARFIEKLGLKVIILHEQPHSGKTIIEKYESFASKAGYAVILLTPDDLGASKADAKVPKFRARQNVIFELGFFIAKLGRNRVCALRKGDVEIPSDYHGVLYVPIDSEGAWKISLAKEMKSVGLPITLDTAL
jgi:hypothetical protein